MLNPKLNILIVDDHPIFLRGLKNVLRKIAFVGQIHQAKNGLEAIKMLEAEKIEVILMDIEMPEMNGVETTEYIIAKYPQVNVIALTMFCEPKLIYGMCKNGAKGYLLKDCSPNEITQALLMVNNNEEYYSPRVQSIMANIYRDYDKSLPHYDVQHQITSSQKEVLLLLCKQYSSKEIADELNITINTVHRHRQDLMLKTGSKNLVGLVIYAIEHGLLETTSSDIKLDQS